MAEAANVSDEGGDAPQAAPRRRWRLWWRALGVLALLLVAGALALWFARERIAGDILDAQLARYDLPARYEIERIGPDRQIIRNLAIGDPARPDLTVERVILTLKYRLGLPEIGTVTLVRPRLFGEWRAGRLSFGALDRAIYRDTGGPGGLPDLKLTIRDGRARIGSPWGVAGVKADGGGNLADGFTGVLAAVTPGIRAGGCTTGQVSLYGRVTTQGGAPAFRGPARATDLACSGGAARIARLTLPMQLSAPVDFDGVDIRFDGEAERLRYAAFSGSGGRLEGSASWSGGRAIARYDLRLRDLAGRGLSAGAATLEGSLRTGAKPSDLEVTATLAARDLSLGQGADALARLRPGLEGTLLAPLLARMRGALVREARGSTLTVEMIARHDDRRLRVAIPEARLRGGGGATLLSVSRASYFLPSGGTARLAGNFATGGEGLPSLRGRMERDRPDGAELDIRMAPYRAGEASLAIPRLTVRQAGAGYTFAGQIRADGPLPGGGVRGLALPVTGTLAGDGAISLWPGCTRIAFDALQYANLALDGRALTLCPPTGRSILRYDRDGLRLAAGAPGLDLAGTLADTPLRLASGPVGMAYPGTLVARDVKVALGKPEGGARFAIGDLRADLGGPLKGRFAGADIRLEAVPLDLLDTEGRWSYTDGVLALEDGRFRLEDRAAPDRFNPLSARGATLRLANNRITADAALREPQSDRLITDVHIVHDLASGAGRADLAVPGITFDKGLQPRAISKLAYGVIANARGTVTGSGHVAWSAGGVTSDGRFSSDGLDFAAVFGPVKRMSGTVVFDDLLGLTTAPDQRLAIGSVNPGIEIFDGTVQFALENGERLDVEGASWPFLGGTLTMQPVTLRIGQAERRSYAFDVRALDSARLVERMSLANISATGIFDGTMAVVFDADGNGRIEDGVLVSRPPGGNIAYVGELTYKDLGAIGNFAFAALRSLDYRQLRVEVDGPLAGEILTRLRFQGVSQGEGAQRNFITRRLGRLPLEFRININAAFYQLINNLRSLYDPEYVRDPRSLGLITSDGTRLREEIDGEDVPDAPATPSVQDPESENMQ